MARIFDFLGSVFVTFVPERYRGLWHADGADLHGPAEFAGLAQMLVCLGLFVVRFMLAVPQAMTTIGQAVVESGGEGLPNIGIGMFGVINAAFQPFNAFLLYMSLEGMIRWLAALSSHQALPTLPLQVIAWIHDAFDKKSAMRALGPLVVDEVRPAAVEKYDLCILSCRPKPHWNPYVSILYKDEFYQMVKEERSSGSRKFTYYLRKNPVGRIVVIVYEYRLDDVLKPAEPAVPWKPNRSS